MRKIALTSSLWIGLTGAVAGVMIAEFFSCGMFFPPSNAAQQSDSARMRELRQMIEAEIGEPAATEAAQCKLVAFGSKPCGGPTTYLVYSLAKTDESRLKQLVSEFNARQKAYNQEQKILSDCLFVTEPEVELISGICKIKSDQPRPAP
jgi:hypothetical protein